jgi:hypothetical protein
MIMDGWMDGSSILGHGRRTPTIAGVPNETCNS